MLLSTVYPKPPLVSWIAWLKRVCGINLSVDPNCGGKLRVIGEVTDPCETAAYCTNTSHICFGDRLNEGGRPRYSFC